jgi:hypothetical protein
VRGGREAWPGAAPGLPPSHRLPSASCRWPRRQVEVEEAASSSQRSRKRLRPSGTAGRTSRGLARRAPSHAQCVRAIPPRGGHASLAPGEWFAEQSVLCMNGAGASTRESSRWISSDSRDVLCRVDDAGALVLGRLQRQDVFRHLAGISGQICPLS